MTLSPNFLGQRQYIGEGVSRGERGGDHAALGHGHPPACVAWLRDQLVAPLAFYFAYPSSSRKVRRFSNFSRFFPDIFLGINCDAKTGRKQQLALGTGLI